MRVRNYAKSQAPECALRNLVFKIDTAFLIAGFLLILGVFQTLSFLSARASIEAATSKRPAMSLARMSNQVSIRAAGRGNPWISLGDGHELLTVYSGQRSITEALDSNLARPLSLAHADFDEDGVPDLVGGYGMGSEGVITLHRGNADSIYPNTPEAQQRKIDGTFTDAPFLSPASVAGAPEPADFLGAGDFDGDSHWDTVTAARGSTRIFLLRGDGHGGLGEATAIVLPGRVTAMITGEINRRDGLDDVVIGVSTPEGAKVLVFEGAEGALRSKPESLSMPSEVTSLALGQLDDGLEMDLAVATGRDLFIVHGRDRRLSLDDIRQSAVVAARMSARALPYAISSIAVGDFTGNHLGDIALLSDAGQLDLLSQPASTNQKKNRPVSEWKSKQLARGQWGGAAQLVCARVSSVPIDNLLVVDSKSQSLNIVADDAEEWRGREEGTLAAAAYRGASAGLDLERGLVAVLPMRLGPEALSGLVVLKGGQAAPAVTMIQPQATLTVTSTNDSGPGSLRDAINQANASPGVDTIRFSIPGGGVRTITPLSSLPTIVEALVIDGTTQPGFSGVPLIELDGTNFPAIRDTGVDGLRITGGGSVVRSLAINRFGDDAIELGTNGGSVIEGNFLGSDPTGNLARGNITGVRINGSPNNRIGGTTTASRNLLSGNDRVINGAHFGSGIQISGVGATGNLVQGNFIGVNAAGTTALANVDDGVFIGQAVGNMIGTAAAGARNVISACDVGVSIFGDGNLVQGNFIGPNAAGTGRLAGGGSLPQRGLICGSSGNTIGGTTTATRNVISDNSLGVVICQVKTTSPNLVHGNFIGTDATGAAALGNSFCGVTLDFSEGNSIGGATAAAGNLISANGSSGISISGSKNNQVQNNFIGTNAAGTASLPNAKSGIAIIPQGQSTVAARSTGNVIGGSGTLANRIAFNGANGVFVASDSSNSILSNSIFSNGQLGISFSPPDASDLSPPVLTSVSRSGGNATVSGRLNGTPNTTFRIELFSNMTCDPSGYGEGERFLDFTTVTTDSQGSRSFSKVVPLPTGQRVTATATDPKGTTSEFSNCIESSGQGADPFIRIVSPVSGQSTTGALITYTIKIRNGGSSTATGVTLTDAIPAGTGFIFVEASQGSTSGPPFLGAGTVTCVIGSLNAGASATIKLTLKITASAPAFDSIPLTNTARISSTSIDTNLANNAASVTSSVTGTGGLINADLAVTSAASSTTVAAGNRITYTVTVRNPGPDFATGVGVVDVIPSGSTFASISSPSANCITPPVGRNGLIQCGSLSIAVGGSFSFSFTVNVIEAPGSTLVNQATSILGGTVDEPLNDCSGLCGSGIPLQRGGSDDPNSNNNTDLSTRPVQGGSLVLLSWDQPTLNPGGIDAARNAAPGSLRSRPATSALNEESIRRIVLPQDGETCFLTRVNIYKADQATVQPIIGNLWRSVPPDQVQATMAAAPAGSFFVLTNVWKCGDLEVESGRSNEASSIGPPGPTVRTVTVAAKLKAKGSGFTDVVQVSIDGVGFRKQAGVSDGAALTQKGLLTDGRSIEDATPFGRTVMIKFVNSDGGATTVPFTRGLASASQTTKR
jgi:uncharacterized repeat protein (TIGR01451 family)